MSGDESERCELVAIEAGETRSSQAAAEPAEASAPLPATRRFQPEPVIEPSGEVDAADPTEVAAAGSEVPSREEAQWWDDEYETTDLDTEMDDEDSELALLFELLEQEERTDLREPENDPESHRELRQAEHGETGPPTCAPEPSRTRPEATEDLGHRLAAAAAATHLVSDALVLAGGVLALRLISASAAVHRVAPALASRTARLVRLVHGSRRLRPRLGTFDTIVGRVVATLSSASRPITASFAVRVFDRHAGRLTQNARSVG